MNRTDRIVLEVAGEPVAQPRAKYDSRNRRTYTPDRTGKLEVWKQRLFFSARALDGASKDLARDWADSQTPLLVVFGLRLRQPKSSKRRWPTTKPDWDNLAKAVQDALEDAGAFGNDCRIVQAFVDERWASAQSPPGATIVIQEAREDLLESFLHVLA